MRVFLLVLVLTAAASAQTPGNCGVGQATGTLSASDVQATFRTTGVLFYGSGDGGQYFVPQQTRLSPLFAASLWVGGTVEGAFRVAGTTYGQGGASNDYYEFWPGPLGDGATPPADCSAFDRVWVVSQQDVRDYEGGARPTPNLAQWPVGLGAPAVDAGGRPLAATPRDRVLDLAAGERPVISGTQTAFWVLNDVGNAHRTTGSEPLGIEVAATAFVVASETLALHQSSFLRYTVTNRNTAAIEDARVSLFTDPDLGNAADDFAGLDRARSMGFVYNADEVDGGALGYGTPPPAFGVDLLGGRAPLAPTPTAFVYMASGDANRGDPGSAAEYDRVMRGLWPDGTPITAGGTGYNQGGPPTTFAFPGDPVTGSFWSEEDTGNGRSVPGDRRFALTTAVGTLAPGASATVDLALIYARGDSRLGSVTALREASDLIQRRYDDGSLFGQALGTPAEPGASAGGLALAAPVPDPAVSRATVRYQTGAPGPARLTVVDLLGREVAVLADGPHVPGEHRAEIDASGLAAGVYVVVLEAGGRRATRLLTVAR